MASSTAEADWKNETLLPVIHLAPFLSEAVRSLAYVIAAVSVGAGLGVGGATVIDTVRSNDAPTFWHAGWQVTLGKATLSPGQGDAAQPTVSIPATFRNLGEDAATFRSELVLASKGRNYLEPGPGQELPEVPGQREQAGRISFIVDGSFTLEDAVLIVGGADENQATMPLSGRGRPETPRPRPVGVNGRVTVDADTFLAVTGVSNAPDCGDPQTIPGPGETVTGLTACFQVPAPPNGSDAFEVRRNQAGALRFRLP